MQRWAFARIDLGMNLKEFMAMCPRQFEALRTRYHAKIEEESYHFELMMAQQAALTFNSRMTYAKQPLPIRDFMPSNWKKQTEKPKPATKRRNKKREVELLRQQLDSIFAMHGAKPVIG